MSVSLVCYLRARELLSQGTLQRGGCALSGLQMQGLTRPLGAGPEGFWGGAQHGRSQGRWNDGLSWCPLPVGWC